MQWVLHPESTQLLGSWNWRQKVWKFAFCFVGNIVTYLRSLESRILTEASGLCIFMEFISYSLLHIHLIKVSGLPDASYY